ncbi:hypothetical protein [Mycobacterium colombiense]
MAERRPPGFTVALRFYDSEEVLSIPRRLRCEAVGAWTLCGSYSANQLSDGYVSNEKLKQLGVRPAIRDALMSTTPEPLWVWAESGDGIQFTRWWKWQRLAADVRAYREAEAARKKRERDAKSGKNPPTFLQESDKNLAKNCEKNEKNLRKNIQAEHDSTCGDDEMSGRTSGGRSQHVRPDSRDPKPKPEPNSGYLRESATESTARDSIAATPAAELVRRTIPREINSATQTALRLTAGSLLKDGTPFDVIEEALTEWAVRTGVGPGILPSLAADVIKRRNGHARTTPNGKLHKMRTLAALAQEERAREQAELTHNAQKEIQ